MKWSTIKGVGLDLTTVTTNLENNSSLVCYSVSDEEEKNVL
jgi:hypothetical protein